MFKYINKRRVISLMLTGFLLIGFTGCKAKEDSISTPRNDYADYSVSEKVDTSKVVDNKSVTNNVSTENNLSKEEKVIKVIEDIDSQVDSYINMENFEKVKQKAKELAVTVIDFVFYNEPINGVTFNELSDSAKEKVMKLVTAIDTKVEKKIPNYKDTIKDKTGKAYSYVTDKLKQGTSYVDSKIEEKVGTDKYNDYKDTAKDLAGQAKEDIKDAVDTTKDVIGNGFSKIKSWYEKNR